MVIFVENKHAFVETVCQMIEFFIAPQTELLIAAAGTIALQHRLPAAMFFPATFRNVFLVVVVLVFLLVPPAAARVVGSPFGGTPTDVTIADALTGYRMGQMR